jgi:thioredoxin-like negative regulator of GroEL
MAMGGQHSGWLAMTGHVKKLSRKKEDAIVALLSQRSVEDAARSASIPSRTLYRWLKEPEFKAACREARRDSFGQASARLQQMSTAAASVLGKIMADPNAPAASRVRAALAIFEQAAKAIEIEDLEARLAALERSAAEAAESEGR